MLFLYIIIGLALFIYLFTKQKKFGKIPSAKRLARIKQSPHFKNGSFQNLRITPQFADGVNFFTILKAFIFNREKKVKPTQSIPSIKTNLLQLNPNENLLIWFGHSSYFIQVDGFKILVDPVFSGSASPLPGGTKAFNGSNNYQVTDFPDIDLLIITHDHWDHLDYKTIIELKSKVKQTLTGLGTAEHLEYWGFDTNKITELDWYEKWTPYPQLEINATPARHFSGRGFKANKALWMSFVIKTKQHKLFIGGDSGYDQHFAEIGKTHGPFDIAILENGQYDHKWPYIHMLPEDFIKAATDINSRLILPVHSSKFALSNHPWHEPLERISRLNEETKHNIITPRIGEKVHLKNQNQVFEAWWRNMH